MKILKKVLLSLLIAASMGAVSTSAVAADAGRIVYAPADAIDMTLDKIKIAIDAIANGSEGAAVAALIKDALDSTKEINANDKVDVARSKASSKLKNARTHAKENALQEAEQELKAAQKAFSDLKGLL
ncbi:hypothetical protein [Methylobacter sp.]|jgi:hypothetical protein|uniref:hypothetical protein n=1 Tax=Methylobacter sp. TaxID=2051955 RepID=UPI003DA1CED0